MSQYYGADDQVEDRPLKDLVSDLTSKLQLLLRKEVELAKIEVQEQLGRAGKAAGMFAGAAVTGFVALLLLAFAAAWGLAEVMAPGLAFLIVGVVFVLVAAVLGLQGRKKIAAFRPVPQQTVETLQQDVQVAKTSLSRGVSKPDNSRRS